MLVPDLALLWRPPDTAEPTHSSEIQWLHGIALEDGDVEHRAMTDHSIGAAIFV